MPTKITVVQCHKWGSALRSHSWASALFFCGLPAFQPPQQCSSALRHGTLALPAPLLVKVAGSTHFPVFFCQLWEKSFNILPAAESQAVERLMKSHRRGQLQNCRVPSRHGELLSLLFVSPNPPKKHTQKKLLCGFLERLRWNKYCLISLLLFV